MTEPPATPGVDKKPPDKDAEETPSPEEWRDLTLDKETTQPFPASENELSFLFQSGRNWLAGVGGDPTDAAFLQVLQVEVQALVANWLKIQNVAVLLGAGASRYASGFVTEGLIPRVRSIIASRASHKSFAAVEALAANPIDIQKNFEGFLSQLAMWCSFPHKGWPLSKLAVSLSEATPTEIELDALLKDIQAAIIVACSVVLPPSLLVADSGTDVTRDVSPHEALLAKLAARDVRTARARVFTTNYDTLIEQAADRLGLFLIDGFFGGLTRVFNSSSWDLDVHYAERLSDDRVRLFDRVLHLYKLHGSVNWRRTESGATNPWGITLTNQPVPGLPPAKLSTVVGWTEKSKIEVLETNQVGWSHVLVNHSNNERVRAIPIHADF